MRIPFNKPYYTGKELRFIEKAQKTGQISGNGIYTRKCQKFLENRFGIKKSFLTTSCTDALEMAAILCKIKPGDEVIVPSFTFVSTANAFVLHGAKIVFADSQNQHPNIDANKIEELISPRTKAIVVVHYAGVACDMNKIMDIATRHDITVIEDAAHSHDAKYNDDYLGSIGHISAFSFHETKNIMSGEGGLLGINDKHFLKRAEVVWEKGTNRAAFARGEIKQYEWIDVGSSFLPSELTAAFLYAQLLAFDKIQSRRVNLWEKYFEKLVLLEKSKKITLPHIPEYASNNGHIFYFLTENNKTRNKLLKHLNRNGIQAVFHYLPLHKSPYYFDKHDGRELPNAVSISERIIRLPFYPNLTEKNIQFVCQEIKDFFR